MPLHALCLSALLAWINVGSATARSVARRILQKFIDSFNKGEAAAASATHAAGTDLVFIDE